MEIDEKLKGRFDQIYFDKDMIEELIATKQISSKQELEANLMEIAEKLKDRFEQIHVSKDMADELQISPKQEQEYKEFIERLKEQRKIRQGQSNPCDDLMNSTLYEDVVSGLNNDGGKSR